VSESALRSTNAKKKVKNGRTELGETLLNETNRKIKLKNEETVLLLCLTSTFQPV